MLRILLDTGLRISEATGLRVGDVGDGQLRVVGKGGHERAVPYGRALDAALRRYLARERPVIPADADDPLLLGRDGRPLTAQAVYQAMRRLARELGLTGVRVSPHTCRHTFAIAFVRNGGNLFALQKILGDRDLAMVRATPSSPRRTWRPSTVGPHRSTASPPPARERPNGVDIRPRATAGTARAGPTARAADGPRSPARA